MELISSPQTCSTHTLPCLSWWPLYTWSYHPLLRFSHSSPVCAGSLLAVPSQCGPSWTSSHLPTAAALLSPAVLPQPPVGSLTTFLPPAVRSQYSTRVILSKIYSKPHHSEPSVAVFFQNKQVPTSSQWWTRLFWPDLEPIPSQTSLLVFSSCLFCTTAHTLCISFVTPGWVLLQVLCTGFY